MLMFLKYVRSWAKSASTKTPPYGFLPMAFIILGPCSYQYRQQILVPRIEKIFNENI